MWRVARIVCAFVLLVVTAGVIVYRTGGETARHSGAVLYTHRIVLQMLDKAERIRPAVVWMGDSTLMGWGEHPSYVEIVRSRYLVPAGLGSVSLAAPGMDFYSYWSLAGRVAALRPRVVVMIANLRTFMPEGGIRGLSDLTAEIPLEDLPQTLALPYYIRGMTVPRLFLARALNAELGEDVFLTFEGVRRDSQDAEALRWLGPVEPTLTASENFLHFVAFNDRLLRSFDRPLGRANPLIDFAQATVRRFTDAGATVLVVVTPVPWERGVAAHYFDDARFAGRIAMLREVVESSGGRLVDLHRALGTKYFRDLDCHFTADGAAEMAELLGPEVRRIATDGPAVGDRG